MTGTNKKPIRVKAYRSDGHQIESRVFAREIHETYCAQRGCKFFGERAAQGVCYSRLKNQEMRYLFRVEKLAREMLAETREIRKEQKWGARRYIAYLENHMLSDWMNEEFTMQELIRLRAEVATLRLRAGKRR